MSADSNVVLDNVRRALKRTGARSAPPVPPAIDEPIARLVHSDIGLADLFVKRATAMKMIATTISVDDLLGEIASFLRERQCSRVMLSDTALLTRLGAAQYLKQA